MACVAQISPSIVFQEKVSNVRHCCEIVRELKREKPGHFLLPSLPWAAPPLLARILTASCDLDLGLR